MYYSRKSARIPNFDYSSCNYYFVTICAYHRRCLFGQPNNLNELGKIIQEQIMQIPSHYESVILDHFVVMPNHIHMIIGLNGSGSDLTHVIGQYKSGVTRIIRKTKPDIEVWQRSFHDHVIRNQKEYEKIWNYIEGNPMKWDEDCFYVASAQVNQA